MSARLNRKPVVTAKSLAKWVTDIEGSGVDAMYNSINNHWGFKWFRSRKLCVMTHHIQSLAHRFKFGPAIGDMVKFDVAGEMFYGYLTQKATPVKTLFSQWNVSYYVSGAGNDELVRCQIYKDMGFPDLWKKSKKLGFELNDMHYANVGYLTTTGKGVIIDFGHCEPYSCDIDYEVEIPDFGILNARVNW